MLSKNPSKLLLNIRHKEKDTLKSSLNRVRISLFNYVLNEQLVFFWNLTKNALKKSNEFLCIGLAIEKVKIYGFFFYIAKNIACSTVLWIFPFKKSTEYARNCRCLYSFKLEWNPLEIFIQNIAIRNLRFCYIWTNHLIFFICISLILLFGKIIYIFLSPNPLLIKKNQEILWIYLYERLPLEISKTSFVYASLTIARSTLLWIYYTNKKSNGKYY